MRVAVGSGDQVSREGTALGSCGPRSEAVHGVSVLGYARAGLLVFILGGGSWPTLIRRRRPTNGVSWPGDTEERKTRALEQIASTLTQIHHELIQVRVQAANVNVTLARKR
jgi:hypothetical protein